MGQKIRVVDSEAITLSAMDAVGQFCRANPDVTSGDGLLALTSAVMFSADKAGVDVLGMALTAALVPAHVQAIVTPIIRSMMDQPTPGGTPIADG